MSPASRPQLLPLACGPAVHDALDALAAALEGTGPPLIPYAAGSPAPSPPRRRRADLPEGLALIVSTSGSSGTPKQVQLTADNLLASADAAYQVLGGPGTWLLAIPPHHIGGLQVLVRALLGPGELSVMDLDHGFTAAGFVAAAASMPATGDPTYVSLVPTQVSRLFEDPDATHVLAGFDAVLVGGAGTPEPLLAQAQAAGVRLISTFGMTETAGGCIYDGIPLPVTEVHIDNDRHIVLGGPTVAAGYLGDRELTAYRFQVDPDGVRWFRTEDLGYLDDAGRLRVTGRADDLINSGGVKIAPGPIEDALVRYLPGVVDACVVGVQDREWGEVVAASVILAPRTPHSPTVADARAALRGVVPDAALPRMLQVVDAFPQLGPGKTDRSRLAAGFGARIGT